MEKAGAVGSAVVFLIAKIRGASVAFRTRAENL